MSYPQEAAGIKAMKAWFIHFSWYEAKDWEKKNVYRWFKVMVQMKYFGDGRDFFKYDLITFMFENSNLKNYVFIPMLTEHREDNEGNITPKHNGDRSNRLFQFISRCPNKSLKHWESWLKDYVQIYKTIQPVDQTFFSNEDRANYWEKFKGIVSTEKAIVFIDSDTGLVAGLKKKPPKKKLEKYILNTELQSLIEALAESSILLIYQHLQSDARKHNSDIIKKINEVMSLYDSILVSVYREKEVAFIVIAKNTEVYIEAFKGLSKYHAKSTHAHKAIYEYQKIVPVI